MYEKIPVPLDGSKLAEVSLHCVQELARRIKTRITLTQLLDRYCFAVRFMNSRWYELLLLPVYTCDERLRIGFLP